MKWTCCLLWAAFFFAACTPMQHVVLDPITVTANAPQARVYRATYPHTTDILHTELQLSFNWDSAYVYGKATIDAKPYFYPHDEVTLNANGFTLHRVGMNTDGQFRPLQYLYDGALLKIRLDKAYTRNERYQLQIDYTAKPNELRIPDDIPSAQDRGLYFINPQGKRKDVPRQIWTQGETEANSTWFPTINGPQEKMTQEIHLTVPNEFITLSNGLLEYSTLHTDGTRTDTWRQELPHSTYLTMIAVGNHAIIKDEWQGKEVSYYVEPAYASTARLVFGKTPEMMDFYSEILGVDYPWEKYSQIVVRDFVSGAMENTSASVFFERLQMTEAEYQDENFEDIVAHELFHHWFGDLVTAESWSNLPINESFATYGEYLWFEHKYGRDLADMHGYRDWLEYLKSSREKQVDVIRFDYADRDQMFDQVTYQKGGRILHYLRQIAGDEAFFKSLNLFLTRFAYKTAEIHDLRLIFEEVTGQDMNWFFNQWFLSSGHPVIAVDESYDEETREVRLAFTQEQDLSKTPLYDLPVIVDLYIDGQRDRRQFLINQKSQLIRMPVTKRPDAVIVDPEGEIPAEINHGKNVQQLVAQYKHSPFFQKRMEALLALATEREDVVAGQVILQALDDQNWLIRQHAVEALSVLRSTQLDMAYPKVRHLALNDPRSYVRAAAITALKTVFANRNHAQVLREAEADKAPSVQKVLAGDN